MELNDAVKILSEAWSNKYFTIACKTRDHTEGKETIELAQAEKSQWYSPLESIYIYHTKNHTKPDQVNEFELGLELGLSWQNIAKIMLSSDCYKMSKELLDYFGSTFKLKDTSVLSETISEIRVLRSRILKCLNWPTTRYPDIKPLTNTVIDSLKKSSEEGFFTTTHLVKYRDFDEVEEIFLGKEIEGRRSMFTLIDAYMFYKDGYLPKSEQDIPQGKVQNALSSLGMSHSEIILFAIAMILKELPMLDKFINSPYFPDLDTQLMNVPIEMKQDFLSIRCGILEALGWEDVL